MLTNNHNYMTIVPMITFYQYTMINSYYILILRQPFTFIYVWLQFYTCNDLS